MTKTEEIRPHQRTCPLCEGMCGIDVSVDGDQVTMVRPNKANVWSRGHICPKGTTLGDLHHDPDRLRTPMIREGTQWRAASWEEAFAHADRLARGVREKYGQSAFASFGGNMSGKGFASGRYMMLLYRLARFAQSYSSSSVDQLPKNVSSFLLYGNMWRIPIPDIDRTDLFVILGANPAESKGSIFSHRDVMGGIRDLRARGGRVVVLDPV
ncbi:MAG: molybdopterin-dependent oxidoreductase, partial [Sphingobium sp.]|nr:molybdopterin-dependent oxidoreductase [Sphingobium sp.]